MKKCAPYIGCRVYLLSKAGVRYEGVLQSIDPAQQTVSLSSVRSLGTEGRSVKFQFPPSSSLYEFIVFKGGDIADIEVLKATAVQRDFDFVAANAQLVREPSKPQGPRSYDKEVSFFDNFKPGAPNPDGRRQRTINVQTFGATSAQRKPRRPRPPRPTYN